MNQEEAEKSYNEEKPLAYLLRGIKVSDGDFSLDCCVAFDRNDVAKEARDFLKYTLYELIKSKNQNL